MNAPLDWVAELIATQPPLLTAKDVTTLLRTTQRNLYRLVSSGRLHAIRPTEAGSSRLLVPRTSLERYLRTLDGSAT